MKLLNIRSGLGRTLATVRGWPFLVPRGRTRIAALLLGVLVLAGAATQGAIARVTALPDNAVLRIGSHVVTDDGFQQRVDVLKALYGLKPPQKGPKLDQFRKDAAKSMAVSLILDQAAKERKVVVPDKEARDTLNKIVEKKLSKGRDAFIKFLDSQGISERDVIDEVKRQLATSRLFEQVTADVKPVTDKEVRTTYQERKKEMVKPERRHLRNIVVDSKKKATNILEQARDGADFAKLAKQHSLDRSTKNKGGDLGTVTAEQLNKPYTKAAFAAEDQMLFGPVKTKHGWNVGQALKIIPSEQLSFDEVKKRLARDLNNKRKLKGWRTWLANQIKTADVEYADGYRPDNPDAPPANTTPR